MNTIALVDDDDQILKSVSTALQSHGFKTNSYSDSMSAYENMLSTLPDLAIFNDQMPNMGGLELLRKIRLISNIPVIFLTSKHSENDEANSLKSGADDVIHKPFSYNLLVERVKAILRRSYKKAFDYSTLAKKTQIIYGPLFIDLEKHYCYWNSKLIKLTVTEFTILYNLASRPGVVKSRNALMDAIYHEDADVTDRTIDSHIKRLRKKFRAVDPNFKMIETMYGVGYLLREL